MSTSVTPEMEARADLALRWLEWSEQHERVCWREDCEWSRMFRSVRNLVATGQRVGATASTGGGK